MEIAQKLIAENLAPLGGTATIAFVAANSREGATTAAITTAYTLSTALAPRVLLIDGNLEKPCLHRVFDLPAGPGLAELLANPALSFESVVRKNGQPFDIITSGTQVAGGLHSMKSPSFGTLLDAMKSRYDYVLFDMSSLSVSPAVSAVMPYFDGVILVVACESTRWEVAQDLKAKLQGAKANILGVVMNKRRFYIPKRLYRFV
jgi:Mrp family chromosome partitioning ATPase